MMNPTESSARARLGVGWHHGRRPFWIECRLIHGSGQDENVEDTPDGCMSDYTILIVDYDPKSIERLRRPLVDAGYRVEVAKNGALGLESFRRSKPAMVLVEAMLPKKHGFEVCQEIKQSEAGRDVPVAIITAVYRGRKYRSQAFHLYKCDEYLEKPFDDAKLLATVRRFLGDRPAAPAAESSTRSEARASADPTPPPSPAPEPVTETTDAAADEAEDREPPVRASSGNGEAAASASDDDDAIEAFTEEDIMSTLDAIMPDEHKATTARRD
jgi:CheY-like chemotaxis protein